MLGTLTEVGARVRRGGVTLSVARAPLSFGGGATAYFALGRFHPAEAAVQARNPAALAQRAADLGARRRRHRPRLDARELTTPALRAEEERRLAEIGGAQDSARGSP